MVKYSLFLCLLSFIGLISIGCAPSDKKVETPEPVKLEPAGPIEGTWITGSPGHNNYWKLELGPKGSVRQVTHGNVVWPIHEGGLKQESPDGNMYVHYIFGPCFWEYDEENTNLRVVITVDEMLIKTPDNLVNVKTVDTLEGPMQEPGKLWKAAWTNYWEVESGANGQKPPQTFYFWKEKGESYSSQSLKMKEKSE